MALFKTIEFDLKRFEKAQEHSYDNALKEINNGRKIGHWMWYIFPQIDGLGSSTISKEYAIKSKEEAIAYLNHDVLGKRLIEISEALLLLEDKSAIMIFGQTDSLKLKSCMTMFNSVSPNNIFSKILDKYFNGDTCKISK